MGWLRRLLFGGEMASAPPRQMQAQIVTFTEQRPDAELAIVGESFHQDDIASLAAASETTMAFLMPEPDNPQDRNAIAVYMRADDGSAAQVGHLSREDAIAYGPTLRHFAPRLVYAQCYLRSGQRGMTGVWLHLGSPSELMGELLLSEQTPLEGHRWRGQTVAFTGRSRYAIHGIPLDKLGQQYLAQRAGMTSWPRVTKQVQLCVCADPSEDTGNLRKAEEYGIEVLDEATFWPALGYQLGRA